MEHKPGSARELLVAQLGANPWNAVEKLRQIGEQKAQAEGVAYQLDQERKPLLARLASEYALAHASENMSEAKLERFALADPRYAAHVKATADAVSKRELANSDYWAIKSELEWDQEAIRHANHMSRLS